MTQATALEQLDIDEPVRSNVMGRVDAVHSAFGDIWEYVAGINWFINGTHKHRLTLDVAEFDGVPAGNFSPNCETGPTGTLFRIRHRLAF